MTSFGDRLNPWAPLFLPEVEGWGWNHALVLLATSPHLKSIQRTPATNPLYIQERHPYCTGESKGFRSCILENGGEDHVYGYLILNHSITHFNLILSSSHAPVDSYFPKIQTWYFISFLKWLQYSPPQSQHKRSCATWLLGLPQPLLAFLVSMPPYIWTDCTPPSLTSGFLLVYQKHINQDSSGYSG